MITNPITLLPNIKFCQSFDCTKLTCKIDAVGLPNMIYLTGLSANVTIGGTPVSTKAINLFNTVSGGVTIQFGSTEVLGVGTSFLSEIIPGSYIVFSSHPTEAYIVSSVTDDTHLNLTTIFWHDTIAVPEVYINTSLEFVLTPSDLGGGASLPNGDYAVELVASFDPEFYAERPVKYIINGDIRNTYRFSVCCTNYCCVFEKIAAVASACDDCINEEDVVSAMFAWALLQSAMDAAGCGNVVDSNAILNKLERYCNIQPCNC